MWIGKKGEREKKDFMNYKRNSPVLMKWYEERNQENHMS